MRPTLVILAGGLGTRLGNLTKEIPKPMIKIENKPFLYWLIENYRRQGFTDIIVNTGYKADVIEDYPWPKEWNLGFIRDSKTFNPKLFYSLSNKVVVNGDTWIHEPLPTDTSGPWILTWSEVDAGAQFTGCGKIRMYCTHSYYDIGSPEGLERFKIYFKKNKPLTN